MAKSQNSKKEALIKRLQNISEVEKDKLFIKYIVMLMIYNFHDYAIEICNFFKKETLVSSYICNYMKNLIIKSLPSKIGHFSKLIFSILFSSSILILLLSYIPSVLNLDEKEQFNILRIIGE